jgi:hypothetical protein
MEATTVEVSIHERIKEQIKRFDVVALLKLLESLGYQASDIFFQSNPSLASSSSICDDIFFLDQGYPRIRLVLNIGLLSNNSSLPSFFSKKMDEGSINPVTFSQFLSFFDHYLIKTALSMSMPEDNEWFFFNWRETLQEYLKLLALDSLSTLELLFQLCFPELEVQGMKFPRQLSFHSSSIILGTTKLGKDCFLHKSEKLSISSVKIFLKADDLLSDFTVPWANEIKKRYKELLFSTLERVNIHLQVVLSVQNVKEPAMLSQRCRLGYCCIGNHRKSLNFLIFSGRPKDFRAHK